jgi:hypothetical protein
VKLELDHFFILTDKPRETGDLLVTMGLNEGFSRDHMGQGTSNRRFEFSNGMLEILYVRDAEECNNGPAKNLKFTERVVNERASPFGLILVRADDSNLDMPFSGWEYQPDYFEPPKAFHVGDNSDVLEEPLCIYAPFIGPVIRRKEAGKFKSISSVQFSVQLDELSETLRSIQKTDRLQVEPGSAHLAMMTLDDGCSGSSKDFRPDLPLIINW